MISEHYHTEYNQNALVQSLSNNYPLKKKKTSKVCFVVTFHGLDGNLATVLYKTRLQHSLVRVATKIKR